MRFLFLRIYVTHWGLRQRFAKICVIQTYCILQLPQVLSLRIITFNYAMTQESLKTLKTVINSISLFKKYAIPISFTFRYVRTHKSNTAFQRARLTHFVNLLAPVSYAAQQHWNLKECFDIEPAFFKMLAYVPGLTQVWKSHVAFSGKFMRKYLSKIWESMFTWVRS